jgi:predicted RNase H-like HicB family nuclease
MSEKLQVTIIYEDAGDGWIMVSIPQIRGVFSQGRTHAEARENVIDALQLMLTPDPDEQTSPDREPLELLLAS